MLFVNNVSLMLTGNRTLFLNNVLSIAIIMDSSNLKGKYPISVCMGTACYVRGSEKLLEEFKRVLGIEVGETTPDGKFSLDCLRCVGACGLAPVVIIGEKVYGRLQSVDVKKIIEDLE